MVNRFNREWVTFSKPASLAVFFHLLYGLSFL